MAVVEVAVEVQVVNTDHHPTIITNPALVALAVNIRPVEAASIHQVAVAVPKDRHQAFHK